MANKGKSSTKDNGPSEPLNEASEAGDVTLDAVDEKTNAVNEPSNGVDESTEAASVDVEISTQVLFSPSPTEWGDCELPLDTESLATPQAPPKSDAVPKVLCDMFNSGARFETAPKFTWNLRKEDKKARLRKELSVSFSVDTIVSSQEIIYGFDSAGIDVDEIISIQRRASNNTWVVSFRSPEAKNIALGVPSITIAGCVVFLGDCENRVQIVNIYEAPTELPDTVLIGRLSHYGKVFSFRRDRIAANIYNGVRTARMRVNVPIPSTIFVAGEPIRIWYPTQPKTCRRCGDPGHLVAQCSSTRCYNCERPGHRVEECDRPKLCGICLKEDHDVSICPFLLYSANVIVQPGDSLYSDVVESISEPAASPTYAGVASRSPEQVEAIKVAQAAAGSQQPPKKPVQKPKPRKKAASESPCAKSVEKKSAEQKIAELKVISESNRKQDRGADRERDHSRGRDAGRDRDRERDRASARDRERDHERHRGHDCSRERDRDRSGRRSQQHRESESSGEDSDYEYVKVKRKHRSRR